MRNRDFPHSFHLFIQTYASPAITMTATITPPIRRGGVKAPPGVTEDGAAGRAVGRVVILSASGIVGGSVGAVVARIVSPPVTAPSGMETAREGVARRTRRRRAKKMGYVRFMLSI